MCVQKMNEMEGKENGKQGQKLRKNLVD